MTVLEFDTMDDPLMEENLKKLGVGGDLPVERWLAQTPGLWGLRFPEGTWAR